MEFNFRPCGNPSCRGCVDGSCQDESRYARCESSWKSIRARADEREKNRRETDCCGNCSFYDGEPGDGTQFCDMKQREVKESGYCYMHKRKG